MRLWTNFLILVIVWQSVQVMGDVFKSTSSELNTTDTTKEDNCTSILYIASPQNNSILKTNADAKSSWCSLQKLPFTTSGNIHFAIEPVAGKIIWAEKQKLQYRKLGSQKTDEDRAIREYEFKNMDLVFVLDSSSSVFPDNFKTMLTFTKTFLSYVDIDSGYARVGVVTFGNTAHVEFKMDDYKTYQEVIGAIDKIKYRYGNTFTNKAFRVIREQMFTTAAGDRSDAPNTVILITDGKSTHPISAKSEAEKLKENGVHIYVIGISHYIGRSELALATPPESENAFSLKDFGELMELDLYRFRTICLGTLDITEDSDEDRAIREYEFKKMDLVFLLDSSRSVQPDNFKTMLTFTKIFLSYVDIDSGYARVGVVTFSDTAHVEFKMDDYKTYQEVIGAIDKIKYRYGNTFTNEAFRVIREQMFTTAAGDRSDAPNTVILIMDGESTNPISAKSEAEKLKENGIHIYVIGIGEDVGRSELALATPPESENAFSLKNFGDLMEFDIGRFKTIFLEKSEGNRKINDTVTGMTLDWINRIVYLNLRCMRSVMTLKIVPEGLVRHGIQINIQSNVRAIDMFHRKLYQIPATASDTINELTLDRLGRIHRQRLIIDLSGTPILYTEVDAKEGRLYYVTAETQPIIYTLIIDEGKSKQIVKAKGYGFTSYGKDLFWIEKSLDSSYKIITLPKDNNTDPKTVFESNKEISGFVVSGLKESTNSETSWSNRKVSECLGKDGTLRQLTTEMICDRNPDCYGDFDEFYCCYDTDTCGLRNLKIHRTDSFDSQHSADALNMKLPFSEFLSEIFSNSVCKVKGIYVDTFGIQKQLDLDYYGQYYIYRQLVEADVLKKVELTKSIEMKSLAIPSLKGYTFSKFQSLTLLSIQKTLLKSIEGKAFMGLGNLDELYLCDNEFLEEIDKNGFDGLFTLKHLNISYNALTNLDADTLHFLHSLESIDLRGNDFRYTNIYFKSNYKLGVIYADSYIVCCMKPPSVTDENCKTPKDAITGCENLINDGILRVFVWIIGIVALLGNMAVIVYRALGAEKPKNESFLIFVTNLTVSDGLMGIYMLSIASHDVKYEGQYAFNEHAWKNSALCNVSGTVSFVSSEASVFFILFITIDRILAVKYPITGPRITRKIALMLSLFAWIISSVAAIIPGQIYHQFYSYSGVCVALPITTEYYDGQFYSIAVFLGFNFVTFIMIAFGQYFIFREIQLSSRRVRSTLTSRDRDAAKMLLLVVITDCFCWLPIGILIIMSQAGFKVPDVVYAWIVVFILPINSAINPFLYTLGPEIRKRIQLARAQSRSRT